MLNYTKEQRLSQFHGFNGGWSKTKCPMAKASESAAEVKASARARSPVTDSMRLWSRHVQVHSLSYFISNRHWAPSQLIYKCTTQAAGSHQSMWDFIITQYGLRPRTLWPTNSDAFTYHAGRFAFDQSPDTLTTGRFNTYKYLHKIYKCEHDIY